MAVTLHFKFFTWLMQLFLGFTAVRNSTGTLPGMLYPRDSESRSVRHLDGMWNFRIDDSDSRNVGFEQKWYSMPLKQVILFKQMQKQQPYEPVGFCVQFIY